MKRRFVGAAVSAAMLVSSFTGFNAVSVSAETAKTPQYQSNERLMEELNRGLVAFKTTADTREQSVDGVYLSWRLLGTESLTNQAFDIYRSDSEDGTYTRIYTTDVHDATNYTDTAGTESNWYKVVEAGEDPDGETAVKPMGTHKYAKPSEVGNGNSLKNSFAYVDIPIDRPDPVSRMGDGKTSYYYSYDSSHEGGANDASVGDIDGDGDYELILKWDPTDSKDSAGADFTGNVYIDAYEIDPDAYSGTANDTKYRKWRIDLGQNVTAGAHYTQFMVYDFDGDGRAEIAMKTAPGTIDGQGNYVSEVGDTDEIRNVDNTASFIGTSGRLKGKNPFTQYLTVFDGETGAALATTEYIPYDAAENKYWGDGSAKYNRSERYLAAVAYLDGVHPSIIMCRGYYHDSVIRAYSWDGSDLTMLWEHVGKSSAKTTTLYGQGNHNLSVGDIDNDGKDEIVYGSAALDDDGATVLGNTYLGHGDAMHMSDFNNDGEQEVFSVKEESYKTYAEDLRNANTGAHFWASGKIATSGDNGRGVMDNIDDDYAQENSNALAIGWSSGLTNAHDLNGDDVATKPSSAGSGSFDNSLIYWDGDLSRELLDANIIQKYTASTGSTKRFYGPSDGYTLVGGSTNNFSKRNYCLTADLWGDWREEIIMPVNKGDSTAQAFLRIYTSTMSTDYRLTTLMHDSQYRLAIAWQNVGYNQPPHTSYYIGSAALATDEDGNKLNYLAPETPYTSVTYQLETVPVTGMTLSESTVSVEKTKSVTVKANLEPTNASTKKVYWSSSDTSVATVSNGIIKGVGEGTAAITAKTKDGGYTAECTVTVYQTHVTGITVSANTLEVGAGYTKTLTASIAPADATDQTITWTSSDTSVAAVADGVVTGISSGIATITATAADGGYKASCTVTVSPMTVTDITGEDVFVTPTEDSGTSYSNVTATSVTISQSEAAVGAEAYKELTPLEGNRAHLSCRITTGGKKIDSSNWNWEGHSYYFGLSFLGADDSNIMTIEQPYGIGDTTAAGALISRIGADENNFANDWTTVVDGLGNIQGSAKRWIVDIEFDYDNGTASATITGTDSTWTAINGQYTKEFDLNGLSLEKVRIYTTDGGDGSITASPQLAELVYEEIAPRAGTSSVIYQRGVTEENAWSDSDLTDWTATGTLQLDTDNDRIYYNTTKPTGAYAAAKTFTIPEDVSELTYNIDWYFGGATSRLSNKEYLQIGNIRLGWGNATSSEGGGYFVLVSEDGGETYEGVTSTTDDDGNTTTTVDSSKKIFTGSNTTYTKNVRMTIDTATQTITSFKFDGEELTDYADYALGEVPDTVSFGFQRGGGTDSREYPVGLDSITVSAFADEEQSTATPKPTADPNATTAPTATPTPTPVPTATPTPSPVPVVTDLTSFTAVERVEVSEATNDDNEVVITLTNGASANNKYAYAYCDFGDAIKDKESYTVDFDSYLTSSSRAHIELADLSQRPGSTTKKTYDTTGVVWWQGINDSSSYCVNSKTIGNYPAARDAWVHTNIVVDTVNSKITYKITDADGTTRLSGTVAYLDTATPTGLSFVDWINSTEAKIKNLQVTTYEAYVPEELVISDPVTADGVVSVTVTNNTSADRPVQLAVAAYDENGVLAGIQISDAATAAAGEELTLTAAVPDGTTVKIMLWDSLSAMKSLMTAK